MTEEDWNVRVVNSVYNAVYITRAELIGTCVFLALFFRLY